MTQNSDVVQAAIAEIEATGATITDINFFLKSKSSDYENALCVLALYPHKFAYCNELGWLFYNDRFWERENAEFQINRSITEMLKFRSIVAIAHNLDGLAKATIPNTSRKKSVRDMLRDLVVVSVADFDNQTHLLNCDNGVVNLKTGKLSPHDPNQKFTYCLQTEYKPDADQSSWLSFLKMSVGNYEEIADFLQMAHGYSLTGDTREECLFYKFGPTRSGKGTHDAVMLALFGEPLARGVSFSMFTKKRDGNSQNFDLAPLRAARFIAASESGRYSTFNEATTKQITGGDRVQCAFKNHDMFDYKPHYKIWLSSNHPVKGDVDDDAFWNRVRVIEFPNSFVGKENKSLKQSLTSSQNLEGALAWCVAGAVKWYKSKSGLVTPWTVAQATQKQRDDLDHVGQWLGECCKSINGNFVTNDTLIKSYSEWCELNGHTPKKAVGLSRALNSKGFEGKIKKVDGKAKRGFLGLILAVE